VAALLKSNGLVPRKLGRESTAKTSLKKCRIRKRQKLVGVLSFFRNWIRHQDPIHDFTAGGGNLTGLLLALRRGQGNKPDRKLAARLRKNQRHLENQRRLEQRQGLVVPLKNRSAR
tara:strand:- start:1450 stop:1797 length:348 start_codon:yes stop_codon:yes gene_type:complete